MDMLCSSELHENKKDIKIEIDEVAATAPGAFDMEIIPLIKDGFKNNQHRTECTKIENTAISAFYYSDRMTGVTISKVKEDPRSNETKVYNIREDLFKCNLCDYVSDKKHGVSQHFKKHKEKPYKCNLCEYRSTQKYNVRRHFMHIHSKEKPYKCNVCGYRTVETSNLKKHIRIHFKDPARRDRMNSNNFDVGSFQSILASLGANQSIE